MYFLIGISLLLVLTMESSSPGVLAMATIGKFGAVCAFAIIYVQAAEIFPTVVRYAFLMNHILFLYIKVAFWTFGWLIKKHLPLRKWKNRIERSSFGRNY